MAKRELVDSKYSLIIEDDSDLHLEALTPEETEERNWKEILEYMKSGKIIERPITNINPPIQGSDSLFIVTVVNGFNVLMRKEDFFIPGTFNEVQSTSKKEKIRREMQLASRALGANVSFVIKTADVIYEGDKPKYVITASRLEAMEKKRDKYFFGKMARDYEEGSTLIKTRVIRTTSKGIYVESMGVESFIESKDLSATSWVNPQEDFFAGDVKYALLTSLDIDRSKKSVSMKLSIAAANKGNVEDDIKNIMPNSKFLGIITGVSEKTYFVKLRGYDIKAMASKESHAGKKLYKNDECYFTVTNIREDWGCVVGFCTLINKKTQ